MEYPVKLIDVSIYEPNIIWDELRNTGIDTVIFKAGQGLAKDPSFVRLWNEAEENGFYRGSYHFYDGRFNSNTPETQAENYVDILQSAGGYGELPLFADIEGIYAYGSDYPYVGWRNWKRFLIRLQELVGNKEIGIYTSWGTFEANSPTEQSEREFFKNFPLWVANYGVTSPRLPSIWDSWVIWQYSESEIVPGVYDYYYDGDNNPIPGTKRITSVDTNWFNGTKDEFISRFNLDNIQQETETPPIVITPPQPSGESETGFVVVNSLNIRDGNTVSASKVGALLIGTEIEIVQVGFNGGYYWGQIVSPDNYANYYCALGTVENQYISFDIPIQKNETWIAASKTIYKKVYAFNNWCNILIVDPDKIKITLTPFDGLRTVSSIADEYSADFAVNGGDFDVNGAVGLLVSNGNKQSLTQDSQPFFNSSKLNFCGIYPAKNENIAYNAVAGKRYIVVNGKVSENTSDAWYAKHPRTLVGIKDTGKVVFVVVDGRQVNSEGVYSDGITLFEAAQLMIDEGCVSAIDLDGGGSSAMYIKDLGGIVNYPIEDGIIGKERYVGDHVLMFVNNNEGSQGGETGEEIMGIKKYRVINNVVRRPEPSFYSTSSIDVEAGFEFESDSVYLQTESIPLGSTPPYTVAWVKLPDENWIPMNHYSKANLVYVEDLGEVTNETPTEPDANSETAYTIEVKDNLDLYVNGILVAQNGEVL